MDFIVFIVAFLVLVAAFFVGYIVGFCNGKDQRQEDAARTLAGPQPFDSGSRDNSPEREHMIVQRMRKPAADLVERVKHDRRASDRARVTEAERADRESRN